MRIHFRYEPDMCRFWIGATDGERYQEFVLQSWMDVEHVHQILNEAENRLSAKNTNTN